MEFGRVKDPTSICFSLPSDPDVNAQVLTTNHRSLTQWYTGLTGWREHAWKGDVYPFSIRPDQFLPAYAGSFNCVELNPTFYHPPSPDMVQKWCDLVPAHFRFCPKVWQGVSHEEDRDPAEAIRAVQEAHAWFGEHLGPAFIQFPARISRAQLAWIETILDHWSPEQELFIEVRDPQLLKEVQWLSRLQDRKIGLVITDVAGHRALAHMQLTVPRTMLRFVATGYPELDRERMKDWIIRLGQWSTSGLSHAWIFLHHADNAKAPAVARLWADCIKELGTTFISMQTPLHYRPYTQGNLFDQG
ncbi:MAG: DUF72 domain-containing protein [Saprospiraceae bacterium]|nr:DUF72 domain-containing protein [Saprospiraceae bacterium]